MPFLLHLFFVLMILTFIFFGYMAFFRAWDKKQYEAAKRQTWGPFCALAKAGEKFYIGYYRLSIVAALVFFIGFYIFEIINHGK